MRRASAAGNPVLAAAWKTSRAARPGRAAFRGPKTGNRDPREWQCFKASLGGDFFYGIFPDHKAIDDYIAIRWITIVYMTQFLTSKRAIVTGGTRGIGRAITESLLEAGCSVLFCGRNAQAVQSTIDELKPRYGTKVFGQSADVSSLDDVAELFAYGDEAMGGIDILVNNAGIGIFAKMAECAVDDWRRVIDVNLSGAFYCSKQAVPRMIEAGGGYVIHIGSLAGKNPFATGAAYNASKFALNGFAEAMMLDHRYDNIRVTSILPGSVDTEFGRSGKKSGSNWKIASEDIADMVIAVLKMPERTMVSRIEMRPSKPQKG